MPSSNLAKRLRDMIKDEDKNYQNKINALRSPENLLKTIHQTTLEIVDVFNESFINIEFKVEQTEIKDNIFYINFSKTHSFNESIPIIKIIFLIDYNNIKIYQTNLNDYLVNNEFLCLNIENCAVQIENIMFKNASLAYSYMKCNFV